MEVADNMVYVIEENYYCINRRFFVRYKCEFASGTLLSMTRIPNEGSSSLAPSDFELPHNPTVYFHIPNASNRRFGTMSVKRILVVDHGDPAKDQDMTDYDAPTLDVGNDDVGENGQNTSDESDQDDRSDDLNEE